MTAEYQRNWRLKNPGKASGYTASWKDKNPDKVKRLAAKWHKDNPEKYLWEICKNRAKKKGILFTIEPSDIVIPEICPLLEIPIRIAVDGCKDNSPSIDRIDNEVGYTPENVWVISLKANRMKNNGSLEEMKLIVKNLETKSPRKGV